MVQAWQPTHLRRSITMTQRRCSRGLASARASSLCIRPSGSDVRGAAAACGRASSAASVSAQAGCLPAAVSASAAPRVPPARGARHAGWLGPSLIRPYDEPPSGIYSGSKGRGPQKSPWIKHKGDADTDWAARRVPFPNTGRSVGFPTGPRRRPESAAPPRGRVRPCVVTGGCKLGSHSIARGRLGLGERMSG